ncbi:MAG: hypothetical protein AB7O45_04010 [Alphaproteobacteria bacterium]
MRAVLEQAPEWRSARLIEGVFERRTELRSVGKPSQTDMMAVVSVGSDRALLAGEGKVDEPFGERVDAWRAKGGGRPRRLAALLATLEVAAADVDGLRYQLLHRTCAAIYEARGMGFDRAAMVVHSFSPSHAGFDDFSTFAAQLGVSVDTPGGISAPIRREGVQLRLGWAADRPHG